MDWIIKDQWDYGFGFWGFDFYGFVGFWIKRVEDFDTFFPFRVLRSKKGFEKEKHH